jgi:hypothetical protein
MTKRPIRLSDRALAVAAGARGAAVAEQEQRRRVVEGDVRVRAWRSWFGRIGFHGIVDGTLTLSMPTEIAAERIKRDYVPAILQAVEAAEVFVERVMLMVRKR